MNQKQKFQTIKRQLNSRHDIPDMILSALVIRTIDGNGKLPQDIRQIYRDKGVPEQVFSDAEKAHQEQVIGGAE